MTGLLRMMAEVRDRRDRSRDVGFFAAGPRKRGRRDESEKYRYDPGRFIGRIAREIPTKVRAAQ
jgi:hypothetical protein